MTVDSMTWTNPDNTSITTREVIHENFKMIQELNEDKSDKTLTIAALSFTELETILHSFKN